MLPGKIFIPDGCVQHGKRVFIMKKQVFWQLPEHYYLHHDLRLAEDRHSLIVLLVLQTAAVVLTFAAGLLVCPLKSAFEMGPARTIMGLGFMCIGLIVYIVAHEWVHGMAIRFITGRQADFGFELKKGMAYAGCDAYLGKKAYLIIALAPLLFWGAVLFTLAHEAPDSWFWYIYGIQIMNVSGSVGDLYVTYLTLKAPEGTVVRDFGTSMMFYSPEK